MLILIKSILFESTFGTASRPPGFDSKKLLIRKELFWFKKTFLIQRWIGKVFLAGTGWPAGGRPAGADFTPFLEPNPYKTCRFLTILAENGSPKRPGRCVDPSRNRAPRLIRKELFDSGKSFFTNIRLPADIFIAKKVFEWKSFLANLRFRMVKGLFERKDF